MRRLIRTALVAAIAAVASPATTAPLIFSGTIQGQLGYGTNPFLVNGTSKGEGYGSVGFSPTVTQRTTTSTTTLSGSYYREQYFHTYGHSETITAGLTRTQQVTQRLVVNAQANYVDTDNALLSPGFDPSRIDVLTTGQHSRIYSGMLGANWQESARDTFGASINGSHSSYGGGGLLIAGNYDQYGGMLNYYHTFTARTQAGFIVSYSMVDSATYPNSRSIQPSLALKQVLSEIWQFNGDVGVIFTHIDGPLGSDSTGLGFHANLCGTYPRRTLCFTVSRQSDPSGIGGLRTDLAGQVSYKQQLSDKQSITFSGLYDDSRSRGTTASAAGVVDLPRERLIQARLDYSRDLTRRLSAGATARYQRRDYSTFGKATAVGGSVNLSYRIGHIQ